jgi:enoyl-[acyl-carrier-protein] reductase (NADH)
MSKRMTRGEFQESLGAFNPVGHSILAFADDKAAGEAAKALRDAGFTDQDIITYTSAELFPDLKEMMRNASGAAGFGYEITLMRRYMTLAGEGAGWVVVYSPDEAQVAKVTGIAKRFGASSAVHYGRLLHEDLI